MAETLLGSEIIKIAAQVQQKIQAGEKVYNLTIGDFASTLFPIPSVLKQYIIEAYQENQTNYPEAPGMLSLRQAVQLFIHRKLNLDYNPNEIVVAAGARPIIFTIFMTLLDAGDKVIFPVPSWNNNHYTHIMRGEPIVIRTNPENHFMPTAEDIQPYLRNANLLALCSPQNPTGTVFSYEQLKGICEIVLDENVRRKHINQKPLYILYDQIYWALTYEPYKHYDPVSICPDLKPYVIYVDGISKSFAATGVRVGWALGPESVISRMRSLLTHIGAWAPKPEQIATARFLNDTLTTDNYLTHIKNELYHRLNKLYDGICSLESLGMGIHAIEPQAALYLTAQFPLQGRSNLKTAADVHQYMLQEAGVAMVPFYAFGDKEESDWYRISVGTVKMDEIQSIIQQLHNAFAKLQ